MENEGKGIVWSIGAQMIALAVGLLMVALIVWAASKAWKKGQSSYNETNYDGNWLGY
jgi:hypothetical protein